MHVDVLFLTANKFGRTLLVSCCLNYVNVLKIGAKWTKHPHAQNDGNEKKICL